jgi:hypothetical protein
LGWESASYQLSDKGIVVSQDNLITAYKETLTPN